MRKGQTREGRKWNRGEREIEKKSEQRRDNQLGKIKCSKKSREKKNERKGEKRGKKLNRIFDFLYIRSKNYINKESAWIHFFDYMYFLKIYFSELCISDLKSKMNTIFLFILLGFYFQSSVPWMIFLNIPVAKIWGKIQLKFSQSNFISHALRIVSQMSHFFT